MIDSLVTMHQVVTGTAANYIITRAALDYSVIAYSGIQVIGAASAVQFIDTGSTDDDVVTTLARQDVASVVCNSVNGLSAKNRRCDIDRR